MTDFRLVLKNLRFYWRTNLAVIAAVIAGTAVIGGALVVGDSVRGSLRQMSLDRLGRIDDVLVGFRFFREDAAQELLERPAMKERFTAVAPCLMVGGTFLATHKDSSRRASNVQVFGTDDRLWGLLERGSIVVPRENAVVLNSRLAERLGAKPGDSVSLLIPVPSTIPRESLLGKREGDFHEIPLTVQAILDESLPGTRDSRSIRRSSCPSTRLFRWPLSRKEWSWRKSSGRGGTGQGRPARVNTLFVGRPFRVRSNRPDGDRRCKCSGS